MKRRTFLKGAALAAAGTAGGLLLGEREARAFGEVPSGDEGSTVPKDLQAENILEIFLYGGLSQYETFYCVEDYGKNDGTGWYLFLNNGDVANAVSSCGITGNLLEPFAMDANGKQVNFGPYVMPLRARSDVMDRVRVAITEHDLLPHEGAIPLALAGRRLGQPTLAGLGAHIQRYFGDRNTDPKRAPFSYVIQSAYFQIGTDNVKSATAIGMHPGAARPLPILVDSAGDLTTLLQRGTVGSDRASYDALMQKYIRDYQARLKWKGQGDPLRAPVLTDLQAGANSIANADAILSVLDPSYFTPFSGSECGDTNMLNIDSTAMSLKLATHLLTHPTEPAKYCCVIDSGLVAADGGGGYDGHIETSHTTARNLGHVLKSLTALINKPGENDPTKLDLDKTMILLTTEFGRTPTLQGDPSDPGAHGRNHWPYGYTITFIGGPIKQRGVFGACGSDFQATLASSPQENRIAALLALGIWPFAPESYTVSDVPGATNEADAAKKVLQRQLGLT